MEVMESMLQAHPDITGVFVVMMQWQWRIPALVGAEKKSCKGFWL
jgi:hypothetical protein